MTAPQRILIVDDEAPAIRRLERMIAPMPGALVCGREQDPRRVAQCCRELRPDVVLLDIEMPGLSGVDLAGELRRLDHGPAIVFVTAFEQYAVEAFDLAAVDYLVKPVRADRLERALARARRREGTTSASLTSRIGDRLITVPLADVRALVAEDKYTMVYHTGGMALVEESLVSLESRFPELFVRVHRKALVARTHVRGMHRDAEGQERVDLEGTDYCAPVSRRNLAALRKLLKH